MRKKKQIKLSSAEAIEVIVEELKRNTPNLSNYDRIFNITRLLILKSRSPLGRLVESIMLNYMIKHNGATPSIDQIVSKLVYIRPMLQEDPLLRNKVIAYYRQILKRLLAQKKKIDTATKVAERIKEALKDMDELKDAKRAELVYIILKTIQELTQEKDTFREEEWM